LSNLKEVKYLRGSFGGIGSVRFWENDEIVAGVKSPPIIVGSEFSPDGDIFLATFAEMNIIKEL
jgi:hypothetical protein